MIDQILEQLDVSQLVTQVVAWAPRVAAAVVVVFVFWLLYRITRGPLALVLHRSGLHDTLIHRLVNSVYKLVVMVFGVVMAAEQIGIDVTAALAGIGIAGIAVGFAAQDSIANIFSGFFIILDKPFEVEDWVTVVGEYGQVTEITMRSTRIKTNRNTYVVIPNKTIIDAVLENHSKHGETRVDIPIGIAYKENIPEARRVVLEAVRDLEGVIANPPPDVVVTEMDDSSINMNVRVWIDRAALEKPVTLRVLEASKLALDAAGIEIPFPHLQLFLENIEDRVWNKAAQFAKSA